MQQLENIRIVLLEPTHPGNIGAVARSMKTMGLSQLVLVKPKKFPHPEASKRAASAADVLDTARVVDDVHSAIEDCTLVMGTSVRDREVTWPTKDPRLAAEAVLSHVAPRVDEGKQQTAILFGRESSGMTNDEMDLCGSQIRIPANAEYSSLNLASAVQIIAYEIRVAALQQQPKRSNDEEIEVGTPAQQRRNAATFAQRAGHLEHLQITLEELDFIKSKPSTVLMRKLTRLYNKAELNIEEVQILRGILSAMQSKLIRS